MKPSVVLSLLCLALIMGGCSARPDLSLPKDETFTVFVYEGARRVRQIELKPGSEAHRRLIAWAGESGRGWSPTPVTYAPGILVRGSSFSLNFGASQVIFNSKEGQFSRRVEPREYQFLLTVPPGGSEGGAAPRPEDGQWGDRAFQEVRAVADLPPAVQAGLGVRRPGLLGVADPGQPFNVTDVVDNKLPMRRLLAAGRDGDTWLVALEQGGRGYHVQVFLFSALEAAPKKTWVLLGRPKTLSEVVQQVSEKERHEG